MCRSCSARRPSRCATGSAARTAPPGAVSSSSSTSCCASCEPVLSEARRAQRAIDDAVAFVTERLNGEDGLGAHLPGDGEHRDDVRHARLRARPSRRRHRLGERAQAAGGRGGPRLLPALPVAGLGHRPCRARGGGGGRRRVRRAGAGGWSGCAAAGAGRRRRLGGGAARRAARRLGVPVRQPALPRRGRHRRGRHAAAPAAATRPIRRRDRAGARLDRRHAVARTAAGARSMPTTTPCISTTSRSPTTARCSTRRPPT